jgi:uncharacterized protein (DUF342 family)
MMSLSEKMSPETETMNVGAFKDGVQVPEDGGGASVKTERERDGYCLVYNEEGVFLRLISGVSEAAGEDCFQYLKRKGLDGVSRMRVDALFKSGGEETIKIAEPCREKILDEQAEVTFEAGNMKAYVTLLPPDPEGEMLTKEKLIALLTEEHRIGFGIDESAVDGLLANKEYGRAVPIARGKEAKDGERGEIEFHFSLDKNVRNVLEEKENGRIDFRDTRKIENVAEGQLLVTRKPAGKGEDGMDVLGRKIPARKGKEAVMPVGKNVVLSEDKLSLFAKVSGVANLQFGKVVVSPAYSVNGDVDMAVGNIDFDGDILIAGNVNSGFSVRAAGSVTVMGVVEDAHIESGGDIILKRGIQGADKGTLRAGGSIYALFIQRADVQAMEKVSAGYIFHSRVCCEGTVELTSEKGMLVGGVTEVGRGLASRTIGAESGIQTSIKLGISPRKRERYVELKKILENIRAGVERMDTALKSTIGTFSAANREVRMEITKKLLALRKEENALKKEYSALETEIAQASEGRVHVPGKVYPGTKITIGTVVYQVRVEESFVTLSCREGKIESIPCSLRVKE